jgi:hypothetical protein
VKLVITTEIDLEEPTVDRGFITWFSVRINPDTDSDPDATIPTDPSPRFIGRGSIAIVHIGRIADTGDDLLDALDADSGDLETLYHVYFDDGGLKEQFFVGFGHDLLYVRELVIDPDWRRRNIELAVVRRLCDTLGQGCELAVMPYDSPEEARAWEQMGFQVSTPGEPSGLMHLGLAYRHPRIVDDDTGGRFNVLPDDVLSDPLPKERESQH